MENKSESRVNVSWSRRLLTMTALPGGPVFTMTTPHQILDDFKISERRTIVHCVFYEVTMTVASLQQQPEVPLH
ncbi:hypothetical protein E2C01_061914 [Portunus trituberculatus]|uniref:Uncharacterized protein n=1 Tax=Portunus trituberculatus TaxID=210409 RepID=A0A5B7H544_PORTR|nr:hypothetical protein [Portunus trituberculatus]